MRSEKVIKNIVLTIVILISTILMYGTVSEARDWPEGYIPKKLDDVGIGDKFRYSYIEYQQNINKLLCIEHGEKLSSRKYIDYYVRNIITIEGNNSYGRKGKKDDQIVTNKYNARLAAGIHYTKGQTRRRAVWYYMYNWMKNVGKKYDNLELSYVNANQEGISAEAKNKVEKYVKSINNESTQSSGEARVINQRTDDAQYTTEKYSEQDYEGTEYYYNKVGPFQFEFYPDLEKMTVWGRKAGKTDAEEIDDYELIIKDKDETMFYDVSSLESNDEFYILIPKTRQIAELTKIELTTEKTDGNIGTISAQIVFLVAGTGSESYQNLILVETSQEPSEGNGETCSIENIPTTADINIVKVDKNNHETKLSGVGFQLRNTDLNKWVNSGSDGTTYVEKQDDASTFYTDDTGNASAHDLLLGNYEFVETVQPNESYEMTNTQFEIENNKQTIPVEVENEQKLIKISGNVWDEYHDGKASTINHIKDNNDSPVKGVRVRLVEKLESSVKYIGYSETDDNGNYAFENVLISDLANYYVEFQYNGLKYQNVDSFVGGKYDNDPPGADTSNSSKAIEGDGRETYNNDFLEIKYGGEYTKGEHVSGNSYDTTHFKNEDTNTIDTNLTYNRSADYKLSLNGKDEMLWYVISADTEKSSYSLKEQYDKLVENTQDTVEEIKNVNLGLYEREQPDISIRKDIQNIKLDINDKIYVYDYNNKEKESSIFGENYFGDVGVRFGDGNYESVTYSRPVYEADYKWNGETENENKGLNVYVTYKITLNNESNLTAVVNGFVDYYDTDYVSASEYLKIGTSQNEGNVTNEFKEYTLENLSNLGEYGGAIRVNKRFEINSLESQNVYLQFKLTREGVQKIVMTDEDDESAKNAKKLKNVAEITSYSSYKDGKIYAGIDTDSAPGNAVPGDKNTYEDDTDYSPPLLLQKAIKRSIEGTVFLDSSGDESTLYTAKIREGSGKLEDGEKGIEGVEIKLIEKSRTVDSTYTSKTVKTDENGHFYIDEFIPGDYELTYTWGKDKGGYDVQKYKATIFDYTRYNDIYATKGTVKNKTWYRDEVNTRYSDALDNYETRKKIDSEYTTWDHNTSKAGYTNNEMTSTTPIMDIGVEYDNQAKNYYIDSGNEYKISNIDFGIVRRSRQYYKIEKNVKAVKVTLANKQVISDIEIVEENGVRKISENSNITANATYMPQDQSKQGLGFSKVELDNELIQGATIEVTYEFSFKNISEVDLVTEDYYKYGTTAMSTRAAPSINYKLDVQDSDKTVFVNEQDISTKTPTTIIDYLDNNWSYESDKNSDWESITKEELKDKDFVEEKVYNKAESVETETDINNRIILYTKEESEFAKNGVVPGKNSTVELHVSKLLTTTDDISLNNETEIVAVTNQAGAPPESDQPGDYIPSTELVPAKTPDASVSEQVIVTPSTGENLNYVVPISIGIIALVTLGIGVILIKKEVLDNK